MTHPIDPFATLRGLIVDLDEVCDRLTGGEMGLVEFATRVDSLSNRLMEALPIPAEQLAVSLPRNPTLTCWLD